VLEELARPEPLALHMRDHVGLATQARDAIIRGQLVDATGALTWLAQHRELKPEVTAGPFLERIREHAQRALDASELRGAAESLGALAASCGDCHRASGRGPRVEPSGLEELNEELTVETHMHGYLWATETLWQGLIGDSALWQTGVQTLATLEAPAKPRKLAGGFAAIAAWGKRASELRSSAERGQAYGELIATCGSCHIANGIAPGRAR
jgi:cytochrome c553